MNTSAKAFGSRIGAAQGHYQKRRFGDLADEIAARFPDTEGLVFEQARYTFKQIAQRIDEAAKRLMVAGVGHGDHVALWLNNCDAWIFTAFTVLLKPTVVPGVILNYHLNSAIVQNEWHRVKRRARHLMRPRPLQPTQRP